MYLASLCKFLVIASQMREKHSPDERFSSTIRAFNELSDMYALLLKHGDAVPKGTTIMDTLHQLCTSCGVRMTLEASGERWEHVGEKASPVAKLNAYALERLNALDELLYEKKNAERATSITASKKTLLERIKGLFGGGM